MKQTLAAPRCCFLLRSWLRWSCLLWYLLPLALLVAGVSTAAAQSVQEELEGGWVRFALTGHARAVAEWGATSVLESDRYWEISRYDPGKALDGEAGTAWVEGAPGAGVGEAILLAFTHYPEALGFINGFARNENLFFRNHRVRTLRVQLFTAVNVDGFATETVTLYDAMPVGSARTIVLSDTMTPQRAILPVGPRAAREAMDAFRVSRPIADWDFPQARTMGVDGAMGIPRRFRYILRLEIAQVYRGSTWEDTCIAEIWPDHGAIAAVTVSEDMRQLVLTTAEGQSVPGYAGVDSVLTLVALSDDAQWAIVIREPVGAGAGRVSSEYAVIHTLTGRAMTEAVFRAAGSAAGFLPFGFQEEGGATWVLYEDPAGNVHRAPCGSLYP
jgi:hypothetical protein